MLVLCTRKGNVCSFKKQSCEKDQKGLNRKSHRCVNEQRLQRKQLI
ncbi:hypothetical protein V6Z11_A08G098700 [Gossypium hirsutum]